MKNAIAFNYNLTAENLESVENYAYSFYVDYQKFYLIKVARPKVDIDEMVRIVSNSNFNFHHIILNRFASPITKIEDSEYILLKILGPEHAEIDIRDIVLRETPVKENSILNRSNWGDLWSEKVDYLEYQVSELASNHPIIKKSFSYYVGLAENAISYFNLLKPENLPLYISHRRISYPTITLNYNNPLDIIIDYRVRDIASYLKIKFFHVDLTTILKDVEYLIEKNTLSPLEYNLLFCRLLYPSYYFDELSNILENDKDESSILVYIENTNTYERFLNEVYNRFSKKSSMIKIDWLIKEKIS